MIFNSDHEKIRWNRISNVSLPCYRKSRQRAHYRPLAKKPFLIRDSKSCEAVLRSRRRGHSQGLVAPQCFDLPVAVPLVYLSANPTYGCLDKRRLPPNLPYRLDSFSPPP